MANSPILHQAFRLAAVIVFGLCIEALRGAMIPGLASIIALTILGTASGPMDFKKAFGAVGLLSGFALFALILTSLATGYFGLYSLSIGVLYLWGFYLSLCPKTAPLGRMFLTMMVVVSALVAASPELAAVIVGEMAISVTIGALLVIIVQAIWPAFAPAGDQTADAKERDIPPSLQALLATMIIVPLHLFLTFDGLAAIVVLLTAVNMLCQPNLTQSKRYGFGFALGNVLGGGLAFIAATFIGWQSSPVVFLFVVVAAALVLGTPASMPSRNAAFFKVAGITFVLMFGMTISPLATSNDVQVIARVGQILVAIGFVLCAISVATPYLRRRAVDNPSPSHGH